MFYSKKKNIFMLILFLLLKTELPLYEPKQTEKKSVAWMAR